MLLGCLVPPRSKDPFEVSSPGYDSNEFFNLLFMPVLLLLRPFVFLAKLLLLPFVYLAKLVYGSLYIVVRYASKYRLRSRTRTPTGPGINKPRQSTEYMYQTANKPEQPADRHSLTLCDEDKDRRNPHNLRLPVELTIQITQHLHHTDLANLARSSHYLRAIFFGSADPSTVAHSLRNFVRCDNTNQPKTACAVCHIPICHVRASHAPLFDKPTALHKQVL